MSEVERTSVRARVLDRVRNNEPLDQLVLSGVDLSGLDLSQVDLSGSLLGACDLSSTKLVEANLRRTFLGAADLTGADLSRAELDGAVFSGAKLFDAELLAYSISFGRTPINLRAECFGGGEDGGEDGRNRRINEDDPYTARATYSALKRYYLSEGSYDDASWAAYRERKMDRKSSWESGQYLRWLGFALLGAISGYGERPIRPIVSSLVVIVVYSIIYGLSSSLEPSDPLGQIAWHDNIYFSAATFCTMSFSDVIPKAEPLGRLLAASEAFLGLFLWGVFIFTLTKRFSAR